MYGWIWRHLPGPVVVRALIALILIAAVLAACFIWVYPALAILLEGDVDVNAAPAATFGV